MFILEYVIKLYAIRTGFPFHLCASSFGYDVYETFSKKNYATFDYRNIRSNILRDRRAITLLQKEIFPYHINKKDKWLPFKCLVYFVKKIYLTRQAKTYWHVRYWMRYIHRFLIVFSFLSCNGTLYIYVCMTYTCMYICMYNLCIILK